MSRNCLALRGVCRHCSVQPCSLAKAAGSTEIWTSEYTNRNDSSPENISDFFRNVLESGFQPCCKFVVLFLSTYDESGLGTAFSIIFVQLGISASPVQLPVGQMRQSKANRAEVLPGQQNCSTRLRVSLRIPVKCSRSFVFWQGVWTRAGFLLTLQSLVLCILSVTADIPSSCNWGKERGWSFQKPYWQLA